MEMIKDINSYFPVVIFANKISVLAFRHAALSKSVFFRAFSVGHMIIYAYSLAHTL